MRATGGSASLPSGTSSSWSASLMWWCRGESLAQGVLHVDIISFAPFFCMCCSRPWAPGGNSNCISVSDVLHLSGIHCRACRRKSMTQEQRSSDNRNIWLPWCVKLAVTSTNSSSATGLTCVIRLAVYTLPWLVLQFFSHCAAVQVCTAGGDLAAAPGQQQQQQ
jgi:hypothetical protein